MRNTVIYFYSMVLCLIASSEQTIKDVSVQIPYLWRFPDFKYPSQQAKRVAQRQGLYVQQNVAILDSDIYFGSKRPRVFVTTPQFRTGIPATISEVSLEKGDESFLLSPFPDWGSQLISNCDGPTSVYRIHIDKCGLLWVLDSGRIETFTNSRRACRPKVLIYDLNNRDRLLARYEFPDTSINDRSNLITLVTESYSNDCSDSIAYIADVNGYGLVVFDLANLDSWRIDYNYFYPFPDKGTMTVAGVTFDLMDGVFGLALGPGDSQSRNLYFHSLASLRECWAPTAFLKDRNQVQQANQLRSQMHMSDDVREGQSTLEVMTDDGIMLFGVLTKTAIACWNSAKPFTKENIHTIYKDTENLQFISGMKLKTNRLIITTSRLQNYIAGNLNSTDIKYRIILIENVDKLIRGSGCEERITTYKKPNKPKTSAASFKGNDESPSTFEN